MGLLFHFHIGLAILSLLISSQKIETEFSLPFDHSNPVIYDNDDHRDVYTDEYMFSLASAGEIDLKGVITTYSADKVEYDLFVEGRQKIIDDARKCGFRNLPDAIAGPFTTLQRPATNQIEDTRPLNSEAGRFIVKTVMQTTPEKPFVFIIGGQFTALADAYLLDPRIADRIIVSGIFGVRDKTYNAGLDAWAWAIVVSKFSCVSISDSETDTAYNKVFKSECPKTPKQKFVKYLRDGIFPATDYHKWMVEKHHPVHPASYMEQDGDGPAVIPLMRPDYITRMERWRCTGIDHNGLPQLVRDNNGPLYLVVDADSAIATQEFWRAIENKGSWGHCLSGLR